MSLASHDRAELHRVVRLGDDVECTSAFIALLTDCQAGFWSTGVGGGNSAIDMILIVLPVLADRPSAR